MYKTATRVGNLPVKSNGHKQSSMSPAMTLLFATACGISVANIYFAQPLLDQISNDFSMDHSIIGVVITITQIFYGLGLLLLVPLGDLLNPRRLIIGHMLLSTIALIIVGTAFSSVVLLVGMALVGILAVVTQTLVAFAANIASPLERGRVVGIVTSGIVIGILLARTFAGIVTDLAGWRSVYVVSAAILFLLASLFLKVLPSVEREVKSLTYTQLIRSTFTLFMQERTLRVRSVLAMLIFADFSILWTSLVLPFSAPPFALSHSAIGAFGLIGVAGALAAASAGKLADRGYGQRTTGIALILLFISWLFISYLQQTLIAFVIGIVLLDLAVQAIHVTNQTMILPLREEARSRLTAGYMMFYSIGSASGSIASTQIYAHFGWGGVSFLGASVSAFALLYWVLSSRVNIG